MPAADNKRSTKPFLLNEIHLFVRGGKNEFGMDFGDHSETYLPEGNETEECEVCKREIVHGWSPVLEAVRVNNGSELMACATFIIYPATGKRKSKCGFQLPANIAKGWLAKGKEVISMPTATKAFMQASQGGSQVIANENMALKEEIKALKEGAK